MKIQLKWLALGFASAMILFVGIAACFLFFSSEQTRPVFRDQDLPNGMTVKIISFYLVWGLDHDDRDSGQDCFQLEYVTSIPNADQQSRDQECLAVFELIRLASELWGLNHAVINAFPSLRRKGRYDIYNFKRDPAGNWRFERHPAKVFVND